MKRLLTFLVLLSAVSCMRKPVTNTTLETLNRKAEPYEHLAWQRAWPDSVFDFQGWQRALQRERRTVAASRSSDPCSGNPTGWTLQGPANVAGRVNTLALHPNSDDILLAGFSAGGIFKTTDGAENWTPVFDDQPELSIGDITYDPQNPNIVYAGTGDPNMPANVFNGNGLYKSTDGGDSWQYLALQQHGIISKVVVDPGNTQVLYVASMGNPYVRDDLRGVYKSTDGGQTWTQSLFISNQAGASDLVINPQNPNILYASFWDRIRSNKESVIYGPHARVYKTTDGGETWTQLQGGLPTGIMGRTGLTISPNNPDKLYAVYVDTLSKPGGLYKTEDGGNTWSPVNVNALQDAYADFGWYFGKVRVNPVEDDEIYMLAIILWRQSAGSSGWSVGAGAHADIHDLVFGQTGRRYLACDGGVYRNNPGETKWTKSKNLPTTQCYHTTYNPNTPDTYYLGAQDNGIQRGNGNGLNNWVSVFSADGFRCAFLPTNADTFWVETQNGAVHKTNDGGDSWQFGQTALGKSDRVNWDMPFFLSKHNPNRLYAGTYRAYFSPASGGWAPVSGDLTDGVIYGPRFHTISAMSESPALAEKIFAGTSDGNVWRREPTSGFIDITSNLPERYVTSVHGSPTLTNRIFVTHSGFRDNEKIPHVYRSDDNGASWNDISGDLPSLPVNDLFVVPQTNDSVIIIAADAGVYYTLNSGANWQRLGTNMPIIPVFDLEHNVANNQILAATFARGVWSYPLDSIYNTGATANPVSLAGSIRTDEGMPIDNVSITTSEGGQTISQSNGQFDLASQAPCEEQSVSPSLDGNWLNGVSTYDLVLISKHILGLDTLETPYRILAGDANRSKSLTTFDIVSFRKLILGIDTIIAGNTSWRFVPEDFVFNDPVNPFLTDVPDTIRVSPQGFDQSNINFIGYKVGDVNGTAISNVNLSGDDRFAADFPLWIKDTLLGAGESIEWPILLNCAPVEGIQFTLESVGEDLQIQKVYTNDARVSDDEMVLSKNKFRLCFEPGLWGAADEKRLTLMVRMVANRKGNLSELLRLGDDPTPSMVYDRKGSVLRPVLAWGNSEQGSVSIFPNPMGKGGALITVQNGTAEILTCELFDPAGRLVHQGSGINASMYRIPADMALQPGTYACKITLSDGREISKPVVVLAP